MNFSTKTPLTESSTLSDDAAALESFDQPGAEIVSFRTAPEKEFKNVIATFLTTLSIFGVYLVQGVLVARFLGPLGRGEFGTAIYFPRDILLYAGLLGGMEIVNSYAVTGTINTRSLKYSAAKLGLISGVITAIFAAILSVIVLTCVGKSYLIPFALLCSLFVPWEHMQLTISAVDRGNKNYSFYNINRLLFAVSFPVLILIAYVLQLDQVFGISPLLLTCILFVAARVVGIAPTFRGMGIRQKYADWRSKNKSTTPEDLLTAGSEIPVPGPLTLLKKGRFYALSMLASEIFERLDIFLIVALATVTESGHYFVAVPAAAMLTVAPNALAVFTFNAGADKNRHVSLRQAIAVMTATAVLQLVSAIVFAMIVPFLIILLYEAPFRDAIPFALWLLPASAIKGFLQSADGYLKGRNKPMVGVKARSLSIAIMLAFVGLVYADLIPSPEQKLLSIPMAACLGQAVSMLIISTAVIIDVKNRSDQDIDGGALKNKRQSAGNGTAGRVTLEDG